MFHVKHIRRICRNLYHPFIWEDIRLEEPKQRSAPALPLPQGGSISFASGLLVKESLTKHSLFFLRAALALGSAGEAARPTSGDGQGKSGRQECPKPRVPRARMASAQKSRTAHRFTPIIIRYSDDARCAQSPSRSNAGMNAPLAASASCKNPSSPRRYSQLNTPSYSSCVTAR